MCLILLDETGKKKKKETCAGKLWSQQWDQINFLYSYRIKTKQNKKFSWQLSVSYLSTVSVSYLSTDQVCL